MEYNKVTKSDRITVIDALRGFALLGVVLVHMQQHYSIFNFGTFEPTEALFPTIDSWVTWLTRNVLMGRFINIFAFLFGMSFFIQMDRAKKKGIDFRKRFLWRMVILFIIGVIGSAFYSGDILSFYALFGLILVLLYPLNNKILIAISILFILGAPRWIYAGYDALTSPAPENTEISAAQQPRPAAAMRQNRPRPENIEKPSFFSSVKQNLTDGRMRTFRYQFNSNGGRGYLTFALFILGLVVGRIRYFETAHLHTRRNILLFIAFSAGIWIIGCFEKLLPEAQFPFSQGPAPVSSLLRMSFNDMSMVLMSAAITVGFVILYNIRSIGRFLDILSPYGRMGLTNYESQGIIGSIIFSLWGFGAIFSPWHPTELFLLGIAFYILQIIFCKIWLNHFRYGPLEWLWRSATYLRWQPFRK